MGFHPEGIRNSLVYKYHSGHPGYCVCMYKLQSLGRRVPHCGCCTDKGHIQRMAHHFVLLEYILQHIYHRNHPGKSSDE